MAGGGVGPFHPREDGGEGGWDRKLWLKRTAVHSGDDIPLSLSLSLLCGLGFRLVGGKEGKNGRTKSEGQLL